MPSRRQEKIARVVKEVVCDAVLNHLGDPRITGFVSVTKVDMAPDLRKAEVYLSILAESEAAKNRTFAAIEHARKRIQFLLGGALDSKFCPILAFHQDEHFQKTLETMRLIDEVAHEFEDRPTEPEGEG